MEWAESKLSSSALSKSNSRQYLKKADSVIVTYFLSLFAFFLHFAIFFVLVCFVHMGIVFVLEKRRFLII